MSNYPVERREHGQEDNFWIKQLPYVQLAAGITKTKLDKKKLNLELGHCMKHTIKRCAG